MKACRQHKKSRGKEKRICAVAHPPPIVNGLPSNDNIMPAGWIPDLKQTGKLLEGKTVAHRSRPFGQSARHLAPVVDAPIHPTRQRYPTLLPTRKAGASTRLDHATVSGFGSFDGNGALSRCPRHSPISLAKQVVSSRTGASHRHGHPHCSDSRATRVASMPKTSRVISPKYRTAMVQRWAGVTSK